MKYIIYIMSYNSKNLTEYVYTTLKNQNAIVKVLENSSTENLMFHSPDTIDLGRTNIGVGGFYDYVINNIVPDIDFYGIFNNDITNISDNFIYTHLCNFDTQIGIMHSRLVDPIFMDNYKHLSNLTINDNNTYKYIENVIPFYNYKLLVKYKSLLNQPIKQHYYGFMDKILSNISNEMHLYNVVLNKCVATHNRSTVRKSNINNFSDYQKNSHHTYANFLVSNPNLLEYENTNTQGFWNDYCKIHNIDRILVTGGSGMVGKHLKRLLPFAIYISSADYDLTSELQIKNLFEKYRPNVIIHLAAKVGGIIDNINHPANYFDDNILMNTLLIKYSKLYNVRHFIGILSTCIYPDIMNTYPLNETDLHSGPPAMTNFSYGYAKRCMAVQIDAYNKQYGTNYNYIIPCNLYSEYDKFDENSHFVAALIKKIDTAVKTNASEIVLFGDGTPLRQFMYANDLAEIIKLMVSNNIYENINVAVPENLTIDEIANIALKSCDAEHLKIVYDKSKPNGQYRKDVSIDKLITLFPDFKFTDLYEGIKKTYNYIHEQN